MKSFANVEYCGLIYWLLAVVTAVFGFAFLKDGRERIRKRHEVLQPLQELIPIITYKIDDKAFWRFAGASALAGYIGGILGLGGGIMLTPIWLSINVEAGECVATSVFC